MQACTELDLQNRPIETFSLTEVFAGIVANVVHNTIATKLSTFPSSNVNSGWLKGVHGFVVDCVHQVVIHVIQLDLPEPQLP